MNTRPLVATLFVSTLSLSVLAAPRAEAMQVFADKDKGVALNVGVLVQPWFQLTVPASAGQGTVGAAPVGAPDGESPSLDFFLRRARLLVYGSVTKELSFFVDTDQPNFGRAGIYTSSTIIQDAFITYTFAPEFKIDAGMMLLPFSHHTIESAAALDALDYHAEMVRFPAGLAFRDFGLQFRGLVADDLIHYRIGVFEGVRNGAVAPPPAPVPPAPPTVYPTLNEAGNPRITGQVRLNAMGSEPDFFVKGLYFAEKPIVSIGVGGDWQRKAVFKLDGAPGTYYAVSGDVFAEVPFSADDEVVGKANLFYYGEGTSRIAGSSAAGGIAFYAEAGFRHTFVEPLAFVEYLQAKNDTLTILAPHVGANFFVMKHTFNVKVDVGYRKTETPATTTKDILGTVQGQVFF